MNRYHFNLGDSTKGPVGFCALVLAESKEEALESLRRAMPDTIKVNRLYAGAVAGDKLEYANVYLSMENVTVCDIENWEEIPEEEEP